MELTQGNKSNETSGILYKYALVLVDIPKLGTKTFSYLIPEDLKYEIKIGSPAIVPFGARKQVNAFVVGFSNYLEENIKPKQITELIDDKPVFDLNYLELLEWVSNYYCCDLNTVIQSAIPLKFLKQSKKYISKTDKIASEHINLLGENELKILSFINDKPLSANYLQKQAKISYSEFIKAIQKLKSHNLIEIENVIDDKKQKTQYQKIAVFKDKKNATKKQLKILDELEKLQEVDLIEFEKTVKTTRNTIQKLEKEGFIEIKKIQRYRNPLSIYQTENKKESPNLNEEQEIAYNLIERKIDNKQQEPILIYGVTGSGKTEIYFKLIEKIIKEGRNILFLAPEIALASQLTQRLVKRFSTDDIALWHSSISDGEKFDVWQKLKNNEIRILIGARSAVFAPLKNIGLIIIDEEHENSYKQTIPAPRYNAKNIAEKIAQIHNASLVLGSATPDICSFYKALNSDNLATLKKRFADSSMAKVSIIDMRQEYNKDSKSVFSRILLDKIEKNLQDKKQTLLLINRRGFSTHTQCLECGEIIKCTSCAIPMILHNDNTLKCHWCNRQIILPKHCPNCGSEFIKSSGLGTQKIEVMLNKFFPTAKIARLDSDVTSTKNSHFHILNDFETGKIDILIGTQMIAKGLDNKNVTLVGVLSADQSFNLPDYRAAERGFQLLTQVAGRAGRGEFNGEAYFQTSNPDFYAIETAKKQDYLRFYEEEIKSRELFDYPPFSQIIKILTVSKNSHKAEKSAQEIASRLNQIIEKKGIQEKLIVLGPTNCILEKINNEYRFQILIKNKIYKKGHYLINSFIKTIKINNDVKLIVDIEPIDIL